MQRIVDFVNEKKWVPCAVLAFFVVCFFGVFCLIRYSDGDDAIFDEMVSTRSFFDYLKFRYETWTGRMGGESMVYVVFRCGGIWFWRIVNALMVAALPLCLLNLCAISASRRLVYPCCSVCDEQDAFSNWEFVRLFVLALTGYLLMDVMTFGHAAVWVNGSIFYTWSIVCGLLAVTPAVKCAYAGGYRRWELAYAIPLGVVATMSIEQIGAALVAFILISLVTVWLRKRRIDTGLVAQAAIVLVAFAVLFGAPGNALRTEAEYADWLPPEFRNLGAGGHLFLTFQWLISSFANEGRLFFLGIWALGVMLLLRRGDRDFRWIVPAALFGVAALLPFAKVNIFSDVGLYGVDPAVPLTKLPSWAAMTAMNKVALFWWTVAITFTVPFLWKVCKSLLPLFVFTGAIACEFVMHFSPTMYASGERVYYMTSILLFFIVIRMYMTLDSEKWKNAFVASAVVAGLLNAALQATVILSKMQ